MTKYQAIAKNYRPVRMAHYMSDEEYMPAQQTASVFIEELDEPQYTGLLDQRGEPLYRMPDDRVIGFDLRSKA